METKRCYTCGLTKELSCFPRTKKKSGAYYYYPNCKECSKPSRQKTLTKYYENNRIEILAEARERHHNTKEYQIVRSREYRQENKVEIKQKRNVRSRQKRAENPSFRLKENVSRMIRGALKKKGSSKRGLSFLKFVGYTMQDLKKHLEQQFEPWMTWDNWGIYNKSAWNDCNSATWAWQIDHIMPQSELPYTSMIDDNFKRCWTLENLRPLSAKQNFLNGIELLRKK